MCLKNGVAWRTAREEDKTSIGNKNIGDLHDSFPSATYVHNPYIRTYTHRTSQAYENASQVLSCRQTRRDPVFHISFSRKVRRFLDLRRGTRDLIMSVKIRTVQQRRQTSLGGRVRPHIVSHMAPSQTKRTLQKHT